VKRITQLTLPNDLDIELLFQNGKIAYTFDFKGETYGNAVLLPSRSVEDIASACLVLFTNAAETHKEVLKKGFIGEAP